MKSMVRMVFMVLLIPIGAIATSEIRFSSHKTKSGALEPSFLSHLAEIFKPDVFIETGTLYGDTTNNALPFFKKIHTIELGDYLFQQAFKRFNGSSIITVHHGSSPKIFAQLLPTIKGSVLFFLDAHYSGGDTAMGQEGEHVARAITSIREELIEIARAHLDDCVILIDDIRGFGAEIDGKELISCWAYPSIQEIQKMLLAINQSFTCVLIGDILLAFDKTKHHPTFSPLAKACTVSRLFDGKNFSAREVMQAEEIIRSTKKNDDELLQINWLYDNLKPYPVEVFYHRLWKGLILDGQKKYQEAYEEFATVFSRYNNTRIAHYMNQTRTKMIRRNKKN